MNETQRNLQTLRKIAETLNQSVDMQEALHKSLGLIVDILEVRSGWVFLYQDREEAYSLAAHYQMPPALAPDQDCWQGLCQCNVMGRDGLITKASNMVRCSRIERSQGDRQGLRYHASIPLETPRAHIGILNISSETGDLFPEEDLDLLTSVGHQMALALERAQLFEHMRNRRLREHRSFLDISNTMLSGKSFQHVLGDIARITTEIFSARSCLLAVDECSYEGPLKAACMANFGFSENLDGQDLQRFLRCEAHGLLRKFEDGQPRLVTPTDEGFFIRKLEAEICAQCPGEAKVDSQIPPLKHLTDGPFYAVAVRSISQQVTIGMLFVGHGGLEKKSEDAYLLSLLANQAALAVEQARTQAIRMAQQTMEHELAMARDIQMGFLPEVLPKVKGYDIAVRYEAARQVSGDFYDFFMLDEKRLGLVVADVAGKGMPAALVMALCRTVLRAMVDEASSPLDAVLKTNQTLVRDNRSDKFVSLFYGVLDLESHCMKYIRAGHNPPFHHHRITGDLDSLTGKGLVLGVIDDPPLSQEKRCLAVGDVIAFYTDGITEAMNANHQEFSEQRLEEILKTRHDEPADKIVDYVCNAVREFRGDTDPSDDFTLIILKRDQAS